MMRRGARIGTGLRSLLRGVKRCGNALAMTVVGGLSVDHSNDATKGEDRVRVFVKI